MKRLGFVLFVVTGCIDSPDEVEELMAEEAMTMPTETVSPDVEQKFDPTGTKCGVPGGPALETAWVWGENRIPVALQVELTEPVETLTVEFLILNGTTIDSMEIHHEQVDGTQVFELPPSTLEDAAEIATRVGVPFGSVSALVTARDSAGEVVGAGDSSTIHFKRDRYGTLTGYTPSAMAAAPELRDAYPEAVVIAGVEQVNTYVRVFSANPGE